jgi:hypothetical protein
MLKNIYLNPAASAEGVTVPAPVEIPTVNMTPVPEVTGEVDLDSITDGDEDATPAAVIEKPVVADTNKKPVEPEPPKPVEAARDYSAFDPDDVEILKKAPNHVFEALKARLPKLYEEKNKKKELEARLQQLEQNAVPQQWYEHPSAFVLHPKYNEISTKLSRAEFEARHYNEQAAAVENGADKFSIVEGYDPKTGEPILKEQTIDPKNQTKIKNVLLGTAMQLTGMQQKLREEVDGFATSFKNNYERLVQDMRKHEDVHFPFFAETPEKPLSPEIKQAMQAVEQLMPPEMGNNPLRSYVIKSGALNILLVNKIKQLEAQLNGKAEAAKETKLAGPSASEMAGSPTGNVTSTIIDLDKEFGD